MSDNLSNTPPKLRQIAENTVKNLLPEKSRGIYEKNYQQFETWCVSNEVDILSENVLLAYFKLQSETKKSSTLWALYSMLRSCLNIYKDIDISKYARLQAFLKRCAQGYEPKKSKILDIDQIHEFIEKADDKLYLAIKTVLLIGYAGACRRDELINMSVKDIQYKDDLIIVSIPKTKNYVPRRFVITTPAWIDLIKKYAGLRPRNVTTERFFLTYRNGYCVNSPIGINTISKMPKLIAIFLKLPNPELFSGHCFRRSSASHIANQGGDLITLKHHGGWKSSTVAEGYIDTSMKRKIEVAQMFSSRQEESMACSSTSQPQSTDRISEITVESNAIKKTVVSNQNLPGISINTYDSSQVNVNVYTNYNNQDKIYSPS